MTFSTVILAGGKSSRMSRDQAFLEIGGQAPLERHNHWRYPKLNAGFMR
jgi:molybdopterin-guanine dinucleotide biosynthesis protein A